MLSFLGEMVEILLNIPAYILFAIETIWNLGVAAIQVVIDVAVLVGGTLPSVEPPPAYVETVNWFFPVGALIAILLPVLTGYVAFLLVRWVYRKSGAI